MLLLSRMLGGDHGPFEGTMGAELPKHGWLNHALLCRRCVSMTAYCFEVKLVLEVLDCCARVGPYSNCCCGTLDLTLLAIGSRLLYRNGVPEGSIVRQNLRGNGSVVDIWVGALCPVPGSLGIARFEWLLVNKV